MDNAIFSLVLFMKVVNWLFKQAFWYLVITSVIFFGFKGRVWMFQISIIDPSPVIELTEEDVSPP